ncbi:HdeD family acid-resistance protein [Falsiroseomonas oryziterrae]|uniref:HdeD family acid-resistance protein n=1 Tax=Falsiroseomonas oryziterrae TaxID=2911368 RepID=UPI001F29AD4A|nr:HdeD family acid-resistance protein [Roseomonas sp. NPKOSM-4]
MGETKGPGMSPAGTPPGPAHSTEGERFHAIRALARGWWLFVLRGVLSILFGVLVFVFPGAGLAFILAFLAAWALFDGAASLVHALRGGPDPKGRNRSRTWLAIDGVLSVLLGIFVLVAPGVSAFALVLVVGAWAIAVGVTRIVLAWRTGNALLGLLGVLPVLLGIWLVLAPGPGLLAVIWIIGIEAVAIGILFVALGLRLRRVANDPHAADVMPAQA